MIINIFIKEKECFYPKSDRNVIIAYFFYFGIDKNMIKGNTKEKSSYLLIYGTQKINQETYNEKEEDDYNIIYFSDTFVY